MSNDLHDPREPDDARPARSDVDPVSRWATEHYGFEDDAAHVAETHVGPDPAQPSSPRQPRLAGRLLLAAGVLGIAVTAGFGGAAVAAAGDDDRQDGVLVVDDDGNSGVDPDDGPDGDAGFDGGFGDGGPRGRDR